LQDEATMTFTLNLFDQTVIDMNNEHLKSFTQDKGYQNSPTSYPLTLIPNARVPGKAEEGSSKGFNWDALLGEILCAASEDANDELPQMIPGSNIQLEASSTKQAYLVGHIYVNIFDHRDFHLNN